MTQGFSELRSEALDPQAAGLLPLDFCRSRNLAVVGPADGDPLQVGMLEPNDAGLVQELKQLLDRAIQPVQLNAYEIGRAQAIVFGLKSDAVEVVVDLSSLREISFDPELGAPELLDDLLSVAVQQRTSDVHIETYPHDVDLRFRIDGFLTQVTTPLSPANVRSVVSRLKVLAGLDPLQHRMAQEGQLSTFYDDRQEQKRRQIDFRISTLPGPHGEDAVIRVLDPTLFRLDLDELGISAGLLQRYRRLISYPSGLILSAGPTVSGKTNTLYATVAALRERQLKIMTVEDPIEYTFAKVNQKNVTPDMGFADTIRAFLRQNPDLILVGEIRDAETAKTVFQAATTGHLVLSTLHARSAVSAIARLRSLGISDDSISHSLVGVLGQRLVARVCEQCQEEYTPPSELVEAFYPAPPQAPFVHGAGCAECGQRGYRGLTGVFELLELERTLAKAISQGVPVTDLEELARQQPSFRHMLADALEKVAQGETTLEEVARRIAPDD